MKGRFEGLGLGCDSRRDSFLLFSLGRDGKGQGFSGTNKGERLSAFGCDSRRILYWMDSFLLFLLGGDVKG